MFQPRPLATPVVGFRSWHTRPFHRVGIGPSHWLGSYNEQYGIWKPGKNVARCNAQGYSMFTGQPVGPHQTPAAECSCGYYVLTDFDEVPFSTTPHSLVMTISAGPPAPMAPMVVGAVVGWGRVVQHGDQGWRAEFAQVIALLDCKVSDEHLALTRQVAEQYGVPVVGRKALELMAMEYGEPAHVEVESN